MADDEVQGIALGLGLDTSGWSSGIAKARAELDALRQDARSLVVNAQIKGGGARGVAGAAAAFDQQVSPGFNVTRSAMRQLRVDMNSQLRQLAQQGQGVMIPVRLGRIPYASMRAELTRGIGEVPVTVRISNIGAQKDVLSALISTQTGATMGQARATVESAAASRGIPKRAFGGRVNANRPYVVGENRRPEVFWPDSAGQVIPQAMGGAQILSRLQDANQKLQPHHIAGGIDWYRKAGEYAARKAAEFNMPLRQTQGILAALSAGTSWEANKTKFERVLYAASRGRPFPYPTEGVSGRKPLDAHVKTLQILQGADPAAVFSTSPKLSQFFRGITGDRSALTIDRWAARTSIGKDQPPSKGPARKALEQAWATAAHEAGLQPAEYQAALWLMEKEEARRNLGQMSLGLARGGDVSPGQKGMFFSPPQRGYCAWCRVSFPPGGAGKHGITDSHQAIVSGRRQARGSVRRARPSIRTAASQARLDARRRSVYEPGEDELLSWKMSDDPQYSTRVMAARPYMPGDEEPDWDTDFRMFPHALRGARAPMLAPGEQMPPPLGTAPLREGYVRGYHMTKPTEAGTAAENLASIRAHGLKLNRALGSSYGEPNASWFSGDPKGYDEAYAVEAHLPARWFNRDKLRTDPWSIGGPSSNMAVEGNISRRRIASWNAPWMRSFRYMQGDIGRTGGTSHPGPWTTGQIIREYGPTIAGLRKRNAERAGQTPGMLPYEDETQGWDQFIADAWRNRHRALGGFAGAYEQTLSQHGGTFDRRGRQPKRGYAVELGHGPIVPIRDRNAFIKAYRQALRMSSGYAPYVGTWVPNDGEIWLGASTVIGQRELANRIASHRAQIAFYDLLRKEEIKVRRLRGDPSPGQLRLPGFARGGFAGGIPELRGAAAEYAQSHGMAAPPTGFYHPIDPEFSIRTAAAYEAMPTGPDALSRRAYRAFADETLDQYDFLRQRGFHFTPSRTDPYQPTARHSKMELAGLDVSRNRNINAFASALEHPLLSNAENWIFRGVHDLFGHLAEGFSIGPRGEMNAAIKHSQMYSPLAQRAMLAETHGQNSVVNFSPTIAPGFGRSIADVNRESPGTIYAAQKAQVLPAELVNEFNRRFGVRAQGGPAHRGGLPRGYAIDFMVPQPGVEMPWHALAGTNPDRLKVLMKKLDKPESFSPAILAVAKQGENIVGSAPFTYNHDEKAWHPQSTYIDPAHRRRGLATAMYSKLERFTGKPVMPSETQTSFGRALWQQGERAFGKPFKPRFAMSKFDIDLLNEYSRQISLGMSPQTTGDVLALSDLADRLQAEARGDVQPGRLGRVGRPTPKPDPKLGDTLRLRSSGPFIDAGPSTPMFTTEDDWHRAKGGAAPSAITALMRETRPWTDPQARRIGMSEHGYDYSMYLDRYLTDNRSKLRDPMESWPLAPWNMKPWSKKAAGGDVPPGTYVTGEIGRELFVPSRLAHMIPPEVMTQIPQREKGGMTEIPPGPSLWQAPEDGWIIPNRLMNKVPRAAVGASFGGGGFEEGMRAEEQRRQEREDELRYQADARAKAVRAHLTALTPTQYLGDTSLEELRRVRAESIPVGGRTPRTLLGAAAGFLATGEQKRLAEEQYRTSSRGLLEFRKAIGPDFMGELTTQVKQSERSITELARAHGKDSDEVRKATKVYQNSVTLREHARDLEREQGEALGKLRTGIPDVAKSFLALQGTFVGYQFALTALNAAVDIGAKTVSPLVDQLTGFSGVASDTTKALADSSRQLGGNVPAAIAQAAPAVGAGGLAYLTSALGPGINARAGAASAQDTLKLFQSAIAYQTGSAVPGVFQGQGGVLGGPVLAEQLGGQIGIGEVLGRGVSSFQSGLRNIPTPGVASDQNLTDFSGFNAPTIQGALTPDQLREQVELTKGLSEWTNTYNDAASRAVDIGGAQATGLKLVSAETAGLTEDLYNALPAFSKFGDYAKGTGIVLADANNKVTTNFAKAQQTLINAGQGFQIESPAAFSARSSRELRGGLQTTAVQGAFERSVLQPSQLALDLLANPLSKASAGFGFSKSEQARYSGDVVSIQKLQDGIAAGVQSGLQQARNLILDYGGGVPATHVMGGAGTGGHSVGSSWGPSTIPASQLLAQFDSAVADITKYGGAIRDLNDEIANAQAGLARRQYANSIRVLSRNLQDALALAGRGHTGGRAGEIERQQFTLGREAQRLQFELSQRQINFQTAVAGFQAPGITGQERAARQAEAKQEASFAQKQLDIQKQQFALEGQAFTVQAGRAVTDLRHALDLETQSRDTTLLTIRNQKLIAANQIQLSRAEQQAASILQQAAQNHNAILAVADQRVKLFGGTIEGATNDLRRVLGLGDVHTQLNAQGQVVTTTGPAGGSGGGGARHAAGVFGLTNPGGHVAMYGEADREGVIAIKNPTVRELSAFRGGGMSGPAPVNIGPFIVNGGGDSPDFAMLAREIADIVETRLGTKAKLIGVRSATS